ncbi:MAG TPA: cupredoxin domain-containing protein [Actinomycetota bacterium]|nr:cupredoxin domain-containing protein [Actinomycetota bacterium]
MNDKFRERAILPLAIPLGGLIFIAVITVAMSQVLLNVPKEIATAVALMTALSVLITASVIAVRQKLNSFELLFMTGAAAFPLVLGLGVALGVVEIEAEPEHAEAEVIELAADKLAFETAELRVPAEVPFELEFTNKEQAPHNVAILEEGEQSTLFREDPIAGPKTVKWKVPALEVGSFPFRCDIHPDMKGVIVATQAETGHGEETAAEEVVEVSAKDSKFDKSELRFTADKETELELNNLDATQPHNVSIYETAESTTPLFEEQSFVGPKKVKWKVPALKAGNYYFKCDVHPNMNGQVVVT